MLAALALAALAAAGGAPAPPAARREAYVTLVSSRSYLLGARVLGDRLRRLSLSEREPRRELLLLAAEGVLDAEGRSALLSEGWRVVTVPAIPNPYAKPGDVKAARVFSKLHIWENASATLWRAYDRMVYLDVDVLPVGEPAPLFGCAGAMCATPSSLPEQKYGAINTGVIVLQPSAAIFAQLDAARHGVTASYNRGDQGFLNVFFGEWCLRTDRRPLLRQAEAAPDCLTAYTPPRWQRLGADDRPNYTKVLPLWSPAAPSPTEKCPLRRCRRLPLAYNTNPFQLRPGKAGAAERSDAQVRKLSRDFANIFALMKGCGCAASCCTSTTGRGSSSRGCGPSLHSSRHTCPGIRPGRRPICPVSPWMTGSYTRRSA